MEEMMVVTVIAVILMLISVLPDIITELEWEEMGYEIEWES